MMLLQHLLDRIAVTLSADVPASFNDRVAAVMTASRFQVSALPLVLKPMSSQEQVRSQLLQKLL